MDRSNIDELKRLLAIQCAQGNWDFDPYMHGMANGMILALATIEHKEPEFLSPPEQWGSDSPQTDIFPSVVH